MGKTVCIGGIIAVGKTTFLKKLTDRCIEDGYSCKLMLEMFTDAVRSMVRTNLPIADAFMMGIEEKYDSASSVLV